MIYKYNTSKLVVSQCFAIILFKIKIINIKNNIIVLSLNLKKINDSTVVNKIFDITSYHRHHYFYQYHCRRHHQHHHHHQQQQHIITKVLTLESVIHWIPYINLNIFNVRTYYRLHRNLQTTSVTFVYYTNAYSRIITFYKRYLMHAITRTETIHAYIYFTFIVIR